MRRILRAQRYLTEANAGLAGFIVEKLHYLDFAEAMRFYRTVDPILSPIDKALLATNDRFYLLVGILNRKDMLHPWLYDRCREVEASPDGHLDLWAREHFKSSIITNGGIIQETLIDPEITIAIFSHNSYGARKFLSQHKHEFEKNPALHECFPDVVWKNPRREAPRWSTATGLVLKRKSNPKEATIEAHGLIDGMPTGGHYQLLVYDDIITEKVAKNPDMVRKATEQWEMSDNLGAGNDVRKWHIGTRYSYADTYSIMLKRGLKERRYPATDNGKLDGKPVLISQKRWDEKVQLQRSTVAAQMLQNPLAGKENTFRPDWFKPWDIRPSTLNVYIMCDPGKGHSSKADRTAIAVVGVDGAGMKYLLDGYRHRMPLSDRWIAIRDLWVKWSTMPGVNICEVGYERYGALTDEDYIREQMREGKHTFGLKILNWVSTGGQSKKDRVERLEPDFKRGRFLLPGVVFDVGFNGPAYWRYDQAENKIIERAMRGPTQNMQRVINSGAQHLCAKPIVRRDEDGKLYDLTLALIDEMLFFPFAPKDDLVDAVSRIYDMDAVTPSIYEDRQVDQLSRAFEEA